MLGIIFKHPIFTIVGLFAINLVIIAALIFLCPKNGLLPGQESGDAGPNFRPFRHDVSKTLEDAKQELQKIEKEEATNSTKIIQLTERLGDYCMSESEFAQAQQFYEKALKARERSKAPQDDDYGQTLIALADSKIQQDEEGTNIAESIKLLLQAKKVFETVQAKDSLRVYTVLTKLAAAYATAQDIAKQEECLRQALAIAEKRHVREDTMLIDALSTLATTLDEDDRYAESHKYYKRIVEINEHELGSSNAGVAKALVNLANNLINQNKVNDAEALFKRAYKIVEASPQMEPTDVEEVMKGYIELLNEQPARKAEAVALAEKCLATIAPSGLSAPFHAQHFSLTRSGEQSSEIIDRLASDFSADGTYAIARTFYRKAIELKKTRSKDNPDSYVDSLVGLGDTYQEERKYQEADTYYQQALSAADRKSKSTSYDGLMKSLADNYYYLHDFSQAERFYKERLHTLESAEEHDSSAIAGAAYDLGVATFAAGKYKDAVSAYKQAVELSADEDDKLDHASNVWALARALGRAGDLKAEERNLRQTIAIYRDEEDSSQMEAARDLIINLRKQQRPDDAVKVERDMDAQFKKLSQADDYADADMAEAYASLLATLNRNAEAETLLRKALKEYQTEEPGAEQVLDIKAKLAKTLFAQGKNAEAETLYAQTAGHAEDSAYFSSDECCQLLHGYAALLRKLNKGAEADKVEQRALAVEKVIPSARPI